MPSPRDVIELWDYFRVPRPDDPVRAIPGSGQNVPIWILGSSLYGAQLAAMLGLPYAFASHFAPAALMHALDAYRNSFRASEQLSKPYAMAGFNVFAAETDEDGLRLRTSARKSTLWLRRGEPRPLPPPDDEFEPRLSRHERAMLDEQGACSAVGSPATVLEQMERFVERTGVDELMIASQIFDHDARVRSFEITMDVWSNRDVQGVHRPDRTARSLLTPPRSSAGSTHPHRPATAGSTRSRGSDRRWRRWSLPRGTPPGRGSAWMGRSWF